jgi:hypothetical protein
MVPKRRVGGVFSKAFTPHAGLLDTGCTESEAGTMKRGKVICFSIVFVYLALAPRVNTQSKPDGPESLVFFVGSWHCDGKFASSGKSISANLRFESILGGKFLLFKHDDEPPFNYHAWSEWGWDAKAGHFVATIQDTTGGIRLFRSPGWIARSLTWTGGILPDSSDQRFVFERLDGNALRVSYSYNKEGSWVAVDSSSCSRARSE